MRRRIFSCHNPEVTGVMVGEGEETFCELMSFYEHPEGKNLEDIRGLVFRRQEFAAETAAGDGMAEKEMTGKEMTGKGTDIRAGRELVRTGEREPMAMDDIPFPYEDLEHFSNRIIYYESKQGMPLFLQLLSLIGGQMPAVPEHGSGKEGTAVFLSTTGCPRSNLWTAPLTATTGTPWRSGALSVSATGA